MLSGQNLFDNELVLFKKKPYTIVEEILHFYTSCCHNPIPCCADKLRQEVTSGNYIIDGPLILYRQDSRPPEEIFETGFSAYALSRIPFTGLIESLSYIFRDVDVAKLDAKEFFELCVEYTVIGIIASPILIPFFTIQALCYMLSCILSATNTYDHYLISRWPALALSTRYSDAIGFYSQEKIKYRYCIYLNGAIDFNRFSFDQIAKGGFDPRGEDNGVRDVGEVFPPDINDQTIDSSQIICAETKFDRDGITLVFNRRFNGYKLIEEFLKENGLQEGEEGLPALTLKDEQKKVDNINLFFDLLCEQLNISADTQRDISTQSTMGDTIETADDRFNKKLLELKTCITNNKSALMKQYLASSDLVPAICDDLIQCKNRGSDIEELCANAQLCIDMINDPSALNHNRLMSCAEKKRGSAILWERALGISLMALGVGLSTLGALVLLGGAALLPTGIFSIPGVAGIATGASLVCGGTALAGIGGLMFHHGRQQGPSKTYANFSSIGDHYLYKRKLPGDQTAYAEIKEKARTEKFPPKKPANRSIFQGVMSEALQEAYNNPETHLKEYVNKGYINISDLIKLDSNKPEFKTLLKQEHVYQAIINDKIKIMGLNLLSAEECITSCSASIGEIRQLINPRLEI